jgi:ABC-2 type transport system ATP-binding protein
MHAIEISNLDKFYDNGLQALTNINLKVKKGEIFALLGPNWRRKIFTDKHNLWHCKKK